MKCSLRAAALTAALLAPASFAQNMLANPGFENGTTGWTTFGNVFHQNAAPPQFVPQSGTGLVSMFGNFSGGFNVSGLFQEFTAQPNDVFTIDAWSRHFSGDALTGGGAPNANWVVMKIAFFDAGNAEIGSAEGTILDGTYPTDTWIDNPPVSGTAPAGTVKMQALILFLQPMFDGGAAHIDDVSLLGPPPNMPAYPGSGEDLTLASAVGGGALSTGAGNDVKTAAGGSVLSVNVASPGGTYTLSPYWLFAQAFPTGMPPTPLPGIPDAWFDFTQPIAFLVDASIFSPTGPAIIAPNGGSTTHYLMPSGLSGTSIMLQGLVISGLAANGVYSITDGHEIQLQ